MGVRSRGRLFGTYALLFAAVAYLLVANWDGDDWRHLDVAAVLFVTTLALDVIPDVRPDSGPIATYGSTMTLVLAVLLLGPVPAGVIGFVTNATDSIRRGPKVQYQLGNTFVYTLFPILVGLIAERWINELGGLGFVLAAAVLVVAFDLGTAAVVMFQSWVHGDLRVREDVPTYLRTLPWLGVAAIMVAGAADGYRAAGLGVLVMFMLALVAGEVLLVRLEAVEVRLRAERDRSATYLRMVGTSVVSLNADGRVAFQNERARALLGDLAGTRWHDLDTGDRILAWTPTAMPDGTTLLSGEDVTERQETEVRMARLAFLDGLTGLENRAVLDRELPVILALADDARTSAAFLLIDVDGFKRVNDDHGHEVGDRVLAEVAARLRAVAEPGELLVRRGGDEFILVAPLQADDEGGTRRAAATVAERVVRVFEARFPVAGRIDVSVATALYPFDGPDLEQVANAAMNGTKQRLLDRAF